MAARSACTSPVGCGVSAMSAQASRHPQTAAQTPRNATITETAISGLHERPTDASDTTITATNAPQPVSLSHDFLPLPIQDARRRSSNCMVSPQSSMHHSSSARASYPIGSKNNPMGSYNKLHPHASLAWASLVLQESRLWGQQGCCGSHGGGSGGLIPFDDCRRYGDGSSIDGGLEHATHAISIDELRSIMAVERAAREESLASGTAAEALELLSSE